MPSPLTMKLIGGLAGLLILVGLVLGLRHYKSLAESRGEKLTVICQATRDASGHKSLKCGDVPDQIKFMGEAVTALSNSLKVQNAAVTALGAESDRQKAEAAKAVQKAATRAREADAVSDRLIASSRSTVPSGASCAPSKAVQEQWQ